MARVVLSGIVDEVRDDYVTRGVVARAIASFRSDEDFAIFFGDRIGGNVEIEKIDGDIILQFKNFARLRSQKNFIARKN